MAAWLLTAVSAVAIAQTKRNVPLRVINPSTQAVIRGALATTHFSVCQLSAVHLSGSNGILRDQRPANCFAASGTTQLLGPFVLDFGRGKDHKIKEIGLYTFGSQLQAVIADNDGNDNFSASARMIAATSGRSLTTQSPGLCQPRCVLPVEPARPGEVFVLRGFRFKRSNYGDSHVRRLAISRTSDGRNVEAMYDEGSGADFDVQVLVEYAYVPASMVATSHTFTVGIKLTAQVIRNSRPFPSQLRVRSSRLQVSTSNSTVTDIS